MKINLTVGGYKDEQGKPWVLPVVRETEVVDIFFNLRTFFLSRWLSHQTLQPLMSTFQRLAGKIFEIFLYRDQSFLHEALKPTEPQWSYCLAPKTHWWLR